MSAGLEDLRAGIDALVARYQVPALVVGVWDGANTELASFGSTEVDEHSVFGIGSITKTFTAEAVLGLVAEGVLGLEDDVRTWLPGLDLDCPPGAVSLRRLMEHTTGLPSEAPGEHWEQELFPSPDELAALLPEVGLACPPGSAFKYSNLGYALLGLVVAAATGTSFEEHVLASVVRPAGLVSTSFLGDTERAVQGHEYDDTGLVVPVPVTQRRAFAPGGGLHCTAHDLLLWASLRAARGVGTQAASDPTTPVRLGWFDQQVDGRRVLGHGGAVPGFQAALSVDVDGSWAAVALTNLLGHGVAERVVTALHQVRWGTPAGAQAALVPDGVSSPDWGKGAVPLRWHGMRAVLVDRPGERRFVFPVIAGEPAPPGDTLADSNEPGVSTFASGRFLGERLRVVRDQRGAVLRVVAPGGVVLQSDTALPASTR